MPLNKFEVHLGSQFMFEPLLPQSASTSFADLLNSREEQIIVSTTQRREENNPTLTYALNAKHPSSFLGEDELAGLVRESSIYDGRFEFTSSSKRRILTPVASVLDPHGRRGLTKLITDLYDASNQYVAYFDLTISKGSDFYRYVPSQQRYLYLFTSSQNVEPALVVLPVVNVLRSILAHGQDGYQRAMIRLGDFVAKATSALEKHGTTTKAAEVGDARTYEAILGIENNMFFVAPVAIEVFL
jgi:hypothetical protein